MLPPELNPLVGKIVRTPAAKMTKLGNHDVLRLPLKNAPWNLVFFRLHPTLFQSLVGHYGMVFSAVSACSAVYITLKHSRRIRTPQRTLRISRCFDSPSAVGYYQKNRNVGIL
jgi:hypothetical protein